MDNINLTIDALHYKIRKLNILNNVSFELCDYQVVSILGPNAAGKSTLLKTLAHQLTPQLGSIKLNDIDYDKQRLKYLAQVGYMPEKAVIIAELSVFEQLQLLANLHNITDQIESIEMVVETCQLQKVLNYRTQRLSLGYRQRLNLAQALLNKPQLLILDEPLNGLDPHLIIEFRNIIQKLRHNTLVLISTHFLAEAEIVSDRVLIMQNGQLLDNIDLINTQQAIDLEEIYMQHMQQFQEAEVLQ